MTNSSILSITSIPEVGPLTELRIELANPPPNPPWMVHLGTFPMTPFQYHVEQIGLEDVGVIIATVPTLPAGYSDPRTYRWRISVVLPGPTILEKDNVQL